MNHNYPFKLKIQILKFELINQKSIYNAKIILNPNWMNEPYLIILNFKSSFKIAQN